MAKTYTLVALAASLAGMLLSAILPVPAAAQSSKFVVGERENIVLLGDSITADGYYGQIMQDAIDARYPERQIRVIARGVHGDTAHGALKRVDVDVVQWRPSWVLINFGINDIGNYSTQEFLHHYEELINRITRDSGAKIGVVSPLYQDRDNPESPKMREFVTGLNALAKRYNALYIPVYETTKRLRPSLPANIKYASDSTHPNKIGYQIFAQTILQAMKFPLERKPINLSIASRRVTSNQLDTFAGQSFTLPLPQPVRVSITNPPLPQATTKRATAPVQLDGKLDEWDTSAPLVLAGPEQMIRGILSWPRDHFKARAFTSYDDEAWYFGIDVEDSVVRNAANTTYLVDRDCIEVCLDLRPATERAAKPWVAYANVPRIGQYLLAPASSEVPQATVRMGTGDSKLIEGVTVASSNTKTGYQIEFRVPVTHFPDGVIQSGATVGFDFSVIDVDRNDRYFEANQLRWSGSAGSAFFNREFGTLTFS